MAVGTTGVLAVIVAEEIIRSNSILIVDVIPVTVNYMLLAVNRSGDNYYCNVFIYIVFIRLSHVFLFHLCDSFTLNMALFLPLC